MLEAGSLGARMRVTADITGLRRATVREWNWEFVFGWDGACVGGVEMCGCFADDGAALAMWVCGDPEAGALAAELGAEQEFVTGPEEAEQLDLYCVGSPGCQTCREYGV